MCRTSIYDARNNFSNLVKQAENGEVVELTRYDKPVAVIISYEEYKTQNEKPSFLDRLNNLKELYADVIDDDGIPPAPKFYPDFSNNIFE